MSELGVVPAVAPPVTVVMPAPTNGAAVPPPAITVEPVAPAVAPALASAVVEAPVVEAPAAPVAPAPPATLLGTEQEAPAAAATEEPASAVPEAGALTAAVEPTEAAAAEEPAVVALPPLEYEPFTWPEGVTVQDDDPGLATFRTLGGEHHVPQEVMQRFAELHASELKTAVDQIQTSLVQRQYDAFADTVKGWEQEFRADPDFKNRVNTVVNDAKWAIERVGGSTEQIQELRDVLLASGIGNHKAVIRAFSNMAKLLKEGRPGPRPAPQSGRGGGSAADRRYGNMNGSN